MRRTGIKLALGVVVWGLACGIAGCDQTERAITGSRERVRSVHAGIEMSQIAQILISHELVHGEWPETVAEFQDIMKETSYRTPEPKDRYGTPYRYQPPVARGELPALSSAGKDGLFDTADDEVYRWQIQ